MIEFNQEYVNAKNDESLRMLARSLMLSQGEFALILARCNYRSLRQRLMEQLRERCPFEFQERVLAPSAKTIETTIQEEWGDEPPSAAIISGLESVRDLDAVLIAANQARDEFRKKFPFPLVLWGSDEVLRRLIRVAPDFKSWASTPIEFEMATDELIDFIQQTANEVFVKVLETGAEIFLDNTALNLGTSSPLRAELESARHELQSRGVKLDCELEASLEFVLGRTADSSLEQSERHHEQILKFWQRCPNLERRGCVLYSLGLWWRTYAERHRAEYEKACKRAKDYFQECVEVFEQCHRKDLVAKFINALGAILQQLEQWNELEAVAKKALTLHQTYPDPFRLARAYGFLAEVALNKPAWTEAKQAAEEALSILESTKSTASTFASSEQSAHLEWVHSFHKGWYLFSLARALSALDQMQEACHTLETAEEVSKPQYNPELYIRILQELRKVYFQQGQYRKAFDFKQKQRSIEHQYGFRAFIGAGRLQPKQQVSNPALLPIEQQGIIAQEIAASGRQQDVNRLVERLDRDDHKLTIIHGQSGVGKSSILQAGLIPALQQKTGIREVLPVLQQVYTDWIRVLGLSLAQALGERQTLSDEPVTFDSTTAILKQLRKNAEINRRIVLIFDQFEEFFFVCKGPIKRGYFYNFLGECLALPHVKVILSLREDYLHYLLECNRIASFNVINNNILDKKILYYLGNFLPEEACSIIQKLTDQAQFSLEQQLIDELVKDLAEELGEVRPIELQVVGAQLQTEKINTLEQYRKFGSLKKLVELYLEEVVKDCGSDNKDIAQLVLYFLTDENNTRPLKTYAELAENIKAKVEQLDLVLKIFVNSRVIFLLQETSAERYQLVHDYLVAFIRQQHGSQIEAELKLTKEQLRQALHHERQALHQAKIAEIEAFNSASKALLLSHDQLGSLLAIIKSGLQLPDIEVPPHIKQQTVEMLQEVLFKIQERNRFQEEGRALSVSFSPDGQMLISGNDTQTLRLWKKNGALIKTLTGHSNSILSVSFSPDNQIIASGSADRTIKLWSRDGQLLHTLKGHSGEVWRVSFSPDAQMIASASGDNTVKLWSIDGRLLRTLEGHTAEVRGVSFSPDGQKIASGSYDRTIKLWSLDGQLLKTLEGHTFNVQGVSFSPDGQMIASASGDKTIKLWSLDGQLLQTLEGHTGNIYSVSFSSDGQVIASASWDKTIKLWSYDGRLLQTLEGHRADVWEVSFSPDNQIIASASADNTIRLWCRYRHRFWLQPLQGHKDAVWGVSFSPDGQMIASGSSDKTVKLWNVDGRLLQSFEGHTDRVWDVSISPDGQMLVSVSWDKTIKFWSLNGTLLLDLKGHTRSVHSVSFSPDNQTIASASGDKTIKLWNRDGNLLRELKEHTEHVLSVRFSSDGQLLASGSADNTIGLWSSNGKFLRTLEGHKAAIWGVSFSPDGQMLASGSSDNTVKLWSIDDGKLIRTLEGHSALVLGVSFSPNGQLLASGSADNTIKLWSRDGELLQTLKGHNGAIWDVTFSPDGKLLASASWDQTVILWNLETICNLKVNELLKHGCDWLHDYLNYHPNISEADRHICVPANLVCSDSKNTQ